MGGSVSLIDGHIDGDEMTPIDDDCAKEEYSDKKNEK